MRVTFKHPPVAGSTDPFKDFNPADRTHYPTGEGVYIYGLRLEVDGEKKFVPLCVGEGNLGDRLWKHYYTLKSTGNNGKELFNWGDVHTLKDVRDVYEDMENYIESNTIHNSTLEKLIWYNNADFFNIRLGLPHSNRSMYGINEFEGLPRTNGHQTSIGIGGDLETISTGIGHHPNDAYDLKKAIEKTKKIFDENFYFIYATDKELEDQGIYTLTNAGHRRLVENTVKQKLHKINIYTTAHADNTPLELDVDLSNIQDKLINVDGHLYGNPYINPLVL